MLASSFLDPVLGIDIHFEMVPTPAPVPLPIPNPFIGVVFDPIGLAVGLALGAAIGAVVGAPFQGPVLYWTAFPATNTGTEAKHIPGHILIPPGIMWAPFPKMPKPVIHPGETPTPALPVKPENDAVVIFGSKTVTVMGSNAVRLGDIALSCSEPLRLPSSVVLAIPKGAPILIGGPMSLDIMAALMASLRTRFVSDSLHALISRLKPSRFRNFLNRAVCFFTGHPVDVASGKVMTEFVDVDLPGPIPLKVERIYSSAFASRPGPVGHGWSHSLDQGIWRERGRVVLWAEDGREIEFDTFDFPRHRIEAGQRVYNPVERLTLHCDDDDAWRVVDHEGQVRHFAPVEGRDDGRAMIHGIASRCGHHEIGFHYGTKGDERGRLEWVRDSGGRMLRLVHDAGGRLIELHLPQPHGEGLYCHRRYEYDDAGDLVAVIDSMAQVWRFAYVTHLMVSETDRDGLSFYFQYDGLGEDAWCVRTWGDGGIYDHTLGYDKHKHITYVTNSLGHTTQYHMNTVGQVVKVVDPLGGEAAYEYDPVTLQQTRETDPLGRAMSYEYDARGNTLKVEWPDEAAAHFEYDQGGDLVQMVDPLGATWTWCYDGRGRVVERRVADGTSLRFTYEGGYRTGVIDAAGQRMRLGRDERGMLDAIHTAEGASSRWAFDALGRMIERFDPQGRRKTLRYDAEGRLVQTREFDGTVIEREYSPEGKLVRTHDGKREVHLSYCGMGRLTRRTEAGTSVAFRYDSEEKLLAIVNEAERAFALEYDECGNVVAELGLGDERRVHARDAAGQVVRVQRPSGSSTSYRYDEAGRIIEAAHSDGTAETYRYREDGHLVEAINDEIHLRFERDPMGKVVREWHDEHWIASAYDANGFRIGLRSSFGAKQEIQRNAAGEVVGLSCGRVGSHATDADRWQMSIHRDLQGHEVERQLPGGVRSRWPRDALGRALRHQVWIDAGWHRDMTYEWGHDTELQLIDEKIRGHRVRLGHDEHGALAWAQYEHEGVVQLRLPDLVGNLFGSRGHDDRRYGPSGELLEALDAEGRSYRRYDDDGNLVEKVEANGDVWAYRWSAAGRLHEVVRPDGKRVELGYDALGRRVVKRFDGRVTRWIWDGNVPLHEWVESEDASARAEPAAAVEQAEAETTQPIPLLTSSQSPRGPPVEAGDGTADADAPPPPWHTLDLEPAPAGLVTWVFDPGTLAPAAKLVGDSCYSIVTDHLGAAVLMLDAEGRAVWAASYGAYGELHKLEGVGDDPRGMCPFRLPGQYEDVETGLHYNRFRYYDPSVGQYTSQDPLGPLGGLTPYGYVRNPAVDYDPCGLTAKELGDAMAQDGRPLSPGQTAHHVVKENAGASNPHSYPNQSRQLLERNGIGVNDPSNGARLWGSHPNQRAQPGHPGRSAARASGNYHGGRHIHGKANDRLIYRILRAAEKRGADVGAVLEDIGRRMEDGRWKNTANGGCY
ncbi:MAG: RHS domain-containing protein [Deltaproteobacteria bacterium]|nr:RHS domain-containing protein [Deltaproteobacteria bacterium]